MIVYHVVSYWKSPHGRENDGEPGHRGTFETRAEARQYLEEQGFAQLDRWGTTWKNGNWRAGITAAEGEK